MQYTRLYTGQDGESYFESVEVLLTGQGKIGSLSEAFPVKEMVFRENEPAYDWDFHNAPARQFIVLLDGAIEITTSLGESQSFYAGDILLVEDLTGKGHKTKNIYNQKRKSLFIKL